MPRIPLWAFPSRIVQLLSFAACVFFPACQSEQQSLVLDDYRLRLTAESSEVDRSSAIAADEGRPVDCLVGHVAGRP
ncbi:MAG: hypothetical protein VYC41_05405, partial [Planctomycetota bacterium]|nr:hypothetical protein [Planctomycetota bacterium]